MQSALSIRLATLLVLLGSVPAVGAMTHPGNAGALEPAPGRDVCAEGGVAVGLGRVAACLEEVTFPADGRMLAGQWFRPEGSGPFPAVVVVRGSGESTRGNPWTESLAAVLVSEGVGVLIPDKRGAGRSEGDWRTASFEELAGDAVAAVEHLARRADVDGGRIGLMGLSQGGQIIPIAGVRSDQVAFLIDVVGSAVPFVENVKFEMLNAFDEQGLEGAELRAASSMLDAAIGYVRGTVSWDAYREALEATEQVLGSESTGAFFISTRDHWRWDFFRRMASFDPVDWWRQVDQPVLVLLGGADANTDSPETERRLRAAFAEVGHRDATLRVFEGLGHSLWTLDGPVAEHGLHPDVGRTLRSWVRRMTGASR